MTTEKTNLNFGLRVEQLLKDKGIANGDFYKAIGIVPQKFYDWKKKDHTPYASTALKVAQYFGVTVEYLLTGNNDPLQTKVDALHAKNHELAERLSAIVSELKQP